MQLNTETGSLVNHLLSGTDGQPEPEEGMGITFLGWTDRHAGTIHRVGRKGGLIVEFWASRDEATRTDNNGQSESQSYSFKPDPGGRMFHYKRDRKGQWRKHGPKLARDSERLIYGVLDESQNIRLGERDQYYDYSF